MPESETYLEECEICGATLWKNSVVSVCGKCLLSSDGEIDLQKPFGAGPQSGKQPVSLWSTDGSELQDLFPELEFIELIASGGMGSVYRAIQTKLGRHVAVKVMKKTFAEDLHFIARFEREAKSLAKLDHPNIVTIHDFGNRGGHYYFVMELVDGPNLHHLITEGALKPGAAVELMPRICEAIQFAHEEGITHRDIKPANIMIDSKGRVKIADFGLAKIINAIPETSLTTPGTAIGTIHYMAPELFSENSSYDERADIYSLGVVFYQMLTSQMPLGDFPRPAECLPGISPAVDRAVMRALARDPEKRFSSAEGFARAIQKSGKIERPPRKMAPILIPAVLAVLALWLISWKPGGITALINQGAMSNQVDAIPRLELSPTLVELKQQGGLLRAWGTTAEGIPFDISAAAGAADLVSVFNAGKDWSAISSNGVLITPSVQQDLPAAPGGVKKACPSNILLSDGTLIRKNEKLPGVRDVISLATASALILFEDGHIENRIAPGDLEKSVMATINEVSSLEEVRYIAPRTTERIGAAIHVGGEVTCWSLNGIFEAEVAGRDLVEIALANKNWMGLRRDGSIVIWDTAGRQRDTVPTRDPPGKAVAIRAEPGIRAAQMEDGTWFAWGAPAKQEIIDVINGLGPALDLQLTANLTKNGLLWIEPTGTAVSRVTPLARPTQPGGRLRGWRSPTWRPASSAGPDLDERLAPAAGIDDFVRVETKFDGHWIAQRASSGILSSYSEFAMESGRDFDGERFQWFVAIDSEGSAYHRIPGTFDQAKMIDSAGISEALRVEMGNTNGYVLLSNGSIRLLKPENKEASKRFKEIQSKLDSFRDVIAIDVENQTGMALHAGGQITTWRLNTGFHGVPGDLPRDVQAIACGDSAFLALDTGGTVHVWSTTPDRLLPDNELPPANLGSARAIRCDHSILAAQIEDGSWVAWGSDADSGLIEQINSLGPVGDIAMTHLWEAGVLYWIEPVDHDGEPEASLQPVSLQPKP